MPIPGYVFVVLTCLSLVAGGPAFAETQTHPVVAKLVAKHYPGARILRRGDLSRLCVAVPDEAAGVVSVDFDGDGGADYAALVNLGRSKEKAEPGEILFDVALVVFMAGKGGGFRKVEIDRFDGFSLAFWLREEPEGELLDWQTRKTVTIQDPGVYADFCGGGAVYFWQGGKFNDVEVRG